MKKKELFRLMKKELFFLAIVLLINLHGISQNPCDFFKTKDITWYGIDFSKAKLVGPDFNNPTSIKETFFQSWNTLILKESDKYNLKKFLKKSSIFYNVELVSKRNLSVDENKLITFNSTDATLKDTDVNDIVKEYNFDKNEGYGVLLIVENFNKIEETGNFYIVFIDLKTKSILLSKKISGKAGGIGLRNYWAGAIYNALKKCKTYYSAWEDESCKK